MKIMENHDFPTNPIAFKTTHSLTHDRHLYALSYPKYGTYIFVIQSLSYLGIRDITIRFTSLFAIEISLEFIQNAPPDLLYDP